MSELIKELRTIHQELKSFVDSYDTEVGAVALGALEEAANTVEKAWGQSWLGYQAGVYYRNLQPPPPGAHFSSEWGFKQLHTMGTRGDWVQFPEDAVENEIRKRAGNPDTKKAEEIADKGRKFLEQKRDDVASIFRAAQLSSKDTFLSKLVEDTENINLPTGGDYIRQIQPAGQVMSRDNIALSQGLRTPPHISILATVAECKLPKRAAERLVAKVRQGFSHMERTEARLAKSERIGTSVFIGHGRSKEWKDLKDFIDDRMRLPWDEFNRIAVAGISNTDRLSAMLDGAAIAFLIFTAEDEGADGQFQARMNVVHEAGLFQGRLGFNRAIVMLEEGCGEFSNIAGLGQIRFPKGNIRAAFHDVRLVLEREGLVESPE